MVTATAREEHGKFCVAVAPATDQDSNYLVRYLTASTACILTRLSKTYESIF